MSIKFYHKINGYSNLQINYNVKNSSKYLQTPKRCSALNELISELIQNLKKKIFSRENTTTSLFQGTIVFRAKKEPAKWVTNNSYQFEIP